MTTGHTNPHDAGGYRRRAASAVMLAWILASPLLARNQIVICPFRRLTGHRCPLCGMTRSFAALLHGEVKTSIAEHPLGWIAALFTAGCLMSSHSAWLDRT